MAFTTISVDVANTVTIVHVLERRIFLKITDHFRDEMQQVIEGGALNLIVDLSQVNVMNSSGLGVLILVRDMIRKKEGAIVLFGLSNMMHEIFARMHLDSFFTITADYETAMAILKAI
jgi:anti-sigma B factor antagonist